MSGIGAAFSGAHDNTAFINLLAGVGLSTIASGKKKDPGPGIPAAAPAQTVAPATAGGPAPTAAGDAPGTTTLAAPATSYSGDATDTASTGAGTGRSDAIIARPTPTSMTPSFISSAALPNYVPPPLQSNVGGKSLVGQ